MGKVEAGIVVTGTAAEAQAVWLDTDRWPMLIEDFGRVVSRDPDWPREGEVRWDSKPHGRGRVVESMVVFEEGVEHVTEIEDTRLLGTQRVTYSEAEDEGGVRMRVVLQYRLKDGGPMMKVTDLLFVRRSLRDSLNRSLRRFAGEVSG